MSRRKQSRPRHVDNDLLEMESCGSGGIIASATSAATTTHAAGVGVSRRGGDGENITLDPEAGEMTSSVYGGRPVRMNGDLDGVSVSDKDVDGEERNTHETESFLVEERDHNSSSPSAAMHGDQPTSSCGKCGIGFSNVAQYLNHMKQCGTRHKILMPYDPPSAHNGFVVVGDRTGARHNTSSSSTSSFTNKFDQNPKSSTRGDGDDDDNENDNFDDEENDNVLEEDEIMYDEDSLRRGVDRNGVDIRGAMHRHFDKFIRDATGNLGGSSLAGLPSSATEELRLRSLMNNSDENFLLSLRNRVAKTLYNRRNSNNSISTNNDRSDDASNDNGVDSDKKERGVRVAGDDGNDDVGDGKTYGDDIDDGHDDDDDNNDSVENERINNSRRKRKLSGVDDEDEMGRDAPTPEKVDPAVEWAIKAAETGLFGGLGGVTLAPLASTSAAVAQNTNGALGRNPMPEEVNMYRSMLLQLQQQQLMQIQMIQQMRKQLIASGINPSLLPADLDLSMMSSEGLASVRAAMSGLQTATEAAKARGESEGDLQHLGGGGSNNRLSHSDKQLPGSAINNHHHHNSNNHHHRILESLKLSSHFQHQQQQNHLRRDSTSSNSGAISNMINNNNNKSGDNKDSTTPTTTTTTTSRTSRSSSPDIDPSSLTSSSSRPHHLQHPFQQPLYPSDLSLTPGSLESKYLSFPHPESLTDRDASSSSSHNAKSSISSGIGGGAPTKNPLEILQEKTAASLSSLQLPPGLKALPPLSSSSSSLSSAPSSSPYSSLLACSDSHKPYTSSSSISSSALFASSPSLSALHKETEALKPSPILPPLHLPLTPEDYKGYIQRGTILERSQYASDDPFFKHKCRFCHKVFGSDSALQIHVRSHTGERPFKCNICGNRFSTKGNLKVHFERHKAKYPHIKMDATPVPEHLDRHPNLMGAFSQPIPSSVPLPPPPSMPRMPMPPPPPHHHPHHHHHHHHHQQQQQQQQQQSPSLPSPSSSSSGTPQRSGPPLTPSSSSSPHTPPTPLNRGLPGVSGAPGALGNGLSSGAHPPPPPPQLPLPPPHHHPHLSHHHPHNSPFPPNFPSPFLPGMSPFGLITHSPRPDAAGFPFPPPHIPMSLPSSLAFSMMPGAKDSPFFHPDFHMRPYLPPIPSSQETSVIKSTHLSPRERPISPVNLHKSPKEEPSSLSSPDHAEDKTDKSDQKEDSEIIDEKEASQYKTNDDAGNDTLDQDEVSVKKENVDDNKVDEDTDDKTTYCSPKKDEEQDDSSPNNRKENSEDDKDCESKSLQESEEDVEDTPNETRKDTGRSRSGSRSRSRSRSRSHSPSPDRSTSRPRDSSPPPLNRDTSPSSPRNSPRPPPSSTAPTSSVISWASLTNPPAPLLPSHHSPLLPPPHHPMPPGFPGLGLPYPAGTPTSFPLPSPFHPVLPMSGPRIGGHGPTHFLPPAPPPPPPPPISSPHEDGSVFRNSILPTKTIDPSENLEQYMEIEKSETSKLEQLVKNIEEKITDPNQCVICHRVLSCKSALQMHYRIHTGERPFKCKICGRSFTTKGNLKTHMGVHRAKPALRMMHQCPVCHKQFTNVLVLQQHIRSHTGSMHHLPPMPMLPSPMDWNHRPMGLNRYHPYGLPHNMHAESTRSFDMTRRSLFQRTPLSRDRSHSADGRMHKLESPRSIKEEGSCDEMAYRKSDRETTSDRDSEKESRPLSASNADIKDENIDMSEKISSSSFSPKLELSKPGDYENAFLPPSFGNAPFDAPLAALEERVKAFDTQISSFEKFRNGMGLGTSIFPHSVMQGDPDLDSKPGSPFVKDDNLADYDSKEASDYINENGDKSYQCDVCDVFFPDKHTLRDHMITTHKIKGLPETAFDSEEDESPVVDTDADGKMFFPAESIGNYCDDDDNMTNPDEDQEISAFTHGYDGMDEDNSEFQENMETNEDLNDEHVTDSSENNLDSTNSNADKVTTSMSSPPTVNEQPDIKREANEDFTKTPPTTSLSSSSTSSSAQSQHHQNSNSNNNNNTGNEKTSQNNNNSNNNHSVNPSSPTNNRQQPGLKHQCMTCMKPFSSASALQIHTRTHTGDKPFKCTVCGKAFTTRGNLKVHMGTHMWNNSPSRRGRRMSIEPPFIMSHMKENPFLPTGFPPRPPHPPPDFFYQYPHPLMNGLGSKLNKMSAAMQGMGPAGMPPLPQIPPHLMQELRMKSELSKLSERDVMFPQRTPSSSTSDTTEIRSSFHDVKSRSISPASAPPHSGELDLSMKNVAATSTSSSSSPSSPQQQYQPPASISSSSISLSMQPSPSASSASSSTPSPSHNKENSSNIALDLRNMSSAAPWLWGSAASALPCPQCGQIFSSPDAREHHIRTQHLGRSESSTPHHIGQAETHPPPKALLA